MGIAFWKDRSVLVTGASGLLGGWLVRALQKRGSRVTVLLRDAAPSSILVQSGLAGAVDVVHGSLADPDLLRRTLSEYAIQTVFHLAAQTQVCVAKIDPVGTLEANVRGTWNLLDAARQCGHVDVVAASSDKAYGELSTLPYKEDQPLHGRYPYDVSKSCMDLICAMYAATYAVPVAITRCANLYGGGDLNFDRLIPGVIRATLQGLPFVIRSDGQFVRDYLYVEDAVDAYLLLAERLAVDRTLRGEAFNIGASERHTVLEVVRQMLESLNRGDLEPVVLGQASSEIREQFLSAEKAERVLGWKARFEFTEGLKRTCDWYRAYFLGALGPSAVPELAGRVRRARFPLGGVAATPLLPDSKRRVST
jgi:CDP-glucose 4,6-dehydratase